MAHRLLHRAFVGVVPLLCFLTLPGPSRVRGAGEQPAALRAGAPGDGFTGSPRSAPCRPPKVTAGARATQGLASLSAAMRSCEPCINCEYYYFLPAHQYCCEYGCDECPDFDNATICRYVAYHAGCNSAIDDCAGCEVDEYCACQGCEPW